MLLELRGAGSELHITGEPATCRRHPRHGCEDESDDRGVTP